MKKWILFVLIVVVLQIFLYLMLVNRQIKEMNRKEQQYDSNGYLLMIDLDNHIMGFYDADNPMKHMGCNQDMPAGDYYAFIINGAGVLLCNDDTLVFIRLTGRSLKWCEENYKSGYPCMVYGRRDVCGKISKSNTQVAV